MPDAENRAPTIKEVADHAGVALSSVSRVVNDHPDVSASMRRKVLASIESVGYEPNLLASSLRRGSTMTIGFLISDISNPLFASIANGASRVLDSTGYAMVLTSSGSDAAKDEEMIRLLRWRRVDGLIVTVADEERPGTIAELGRLDVPVVLVDREIAGLPDASVVRTDHATGMRAATTHLIREGHTRIALITSATNVRPTRDRLAGFRAAFSAAGVAPPEDLIRLGSFSATYGESCTTELMHLADRPTALVAGGNLVLEGVLRGLYDLGLRIGEDVALVSCDDTPITQFHSPPITTIARDTERTGEVAAKLLLGLIDESTTGPQIEGLPTRLLVRGSTQSRHVPAARA